VKAEVLCEPCHSLVHGILRLILRRRGRYDIAIVGHREEYSELDHRSLLLDDVSHIAGDNTKISA